MKTNEMKYQIRYQHRSWDEAGSMAGALRAVRREAGVSRLMRVSVPDGTYCYASAAALRADANDGSHALAVICGPGQRDC